MYEFGKVGFNAGRGGGSNQQGRQILAFHLARTKQEGDRHDACLCYNVSVRVRKSHLGERLTKLCQIQESWYFTVHPEVNLEYM